MTDKMREAFESRADVALDYERDESGEYMYDIVRQAYQDFREGWEAAIAFQAAESGRANAALHATIQTQALDLVTARGEAEEAHRDALRLHILCDNLEHDGFGWWFPSACIKVQPVYRDEDRPTIDEMRDTIDAMQQHKESGK